MKGASHGAIAALCALVTTSVSAATPRVQQITYELTMPIATHDFDKQSAPPEGYPTVHVAATCAVGSDLVFGGSTISGDVVAHATGTGTAYGRQPSRVRVTVVVPPASYLRYVASKNHGYVCSFVAGPIRDRTGVIITPRNVTGSASGTLPVPPAPNS